MARSGGVVGRIGTRRQGNISCRASGRGDTARAVLILDGLGGRVVVAVVAVGGGCSVNFRAITVGRICISVIVAVSSLAVGLGCFQSGDGVHAACAWFVRCVATDKGAGAVLFTPAVHRSWILDGSKGCILWDAEDATIRGAAAMIIKELGAFVDGTGTWVLGGMTATEGGPRG